MNSTTTCQFSLPRTWEDIPPDSQNDFWQYSKIDCLTENNPNKQFEIIENATTGAEFYLNKEITYGDFLILTFLVIFLIFGVMKFLINFIIPKRMNFKR